MDELPPPAEFDQKSPRRLWRLAAVVVGLGLAFGLAGAYVQIPYYTLGPGPARDVTDFVHVSGERVYPSDGAFLLTTVSVSSRPVSLFEALVGWIDPAIAVVERSVVIRPGLSDEQQDQFNALDMERSKYSAIIAALRSVGVEAPPIPGVRVIAVAAGFPAEGKLKPGDVIVAANGVRVRDVSELIAAIEKSPAGSELSLAVERDTGSLDVTMRTMPSPVAGEERRPVIGAALGAAFRFPFGVTLDSQNIGGPSAGLAFALTIADVLTTEDLTRGHRVAVTGTIDLNGGVGPVGGVAFKVRAAEREGADVFLVPADEVSEANDAASDIKVIGVATLEEALAALRRLDRRAPAPS